jgi:integrase
MPATPHGYERVDLLHSAATLLFAAGGSLREAQELPGHTSFSLTGNTYAHVLDAQREATADRLEVALGGAITGSRESVRGT